MVLEAILNRLAAVSMNHESAFSDAGSIRTLFIVDISARRSAVKVQRIAVSGL